MANVSFKRGLQATINEWLNTSGKSDYTEGAFYLTTDTDRLYFAQSSSKLVDLNKYVKIYDNVKSLPSSSSGSASPAIGDFAYTTEENILCVWATHLNSSGKEETGWVLINPDTTLDTKNTTVGLSASTRTNSTTNESEDVISIATTIQDSAENQAALVYDIIASTGLVAEIETIKNTDGTVKKYQLVLKSTASNTTYTLGTVATSDNTTGTIRLTDSNDVKNDVNITSANTDLLKIKSDGTKTITLTPQTPVKSHSASVAQSGGNITIDVVTADDETKTATFKPIIAYGDKGDQEAVFVRSGSGTNEGTATLSVYSKSETDDKISAALQKNDAMTYKGVVTNTTLPAITTVHNGDTYKASEAIEFTNSKGVKVTANTGDLIIASGTEDSTTGLITSGDWDVVPSGDDQFIEALSSGTTFAIGDKLLDNDIIAQLILQSDGTSPISVKGNVTSDKKTNTITISHDAVDKTTYPDGTATETWANNTESKTLTAVKEITKDDYGHIQKLTTETITLNHNKLDLSKKKAETSASGNVGTISMTVADTLENEAINSVHLKSTSLSVEAYDSNTSGSSTAVPGLSIDLVWGTF